MKSLYSITCHESHESIIDLCLNLLEVANASFVVVHINKNSDDVYQNVLNSLEEYSELRNKIFINENRFDTSKDKFFLHMAHLSNYDLAIKNNLLFDFFVLEASNSLYVKKGVLNYMEQFDVGLDFDKPEGYWQDSILSHKSLKTFTEHNYQFEDGESFENLKIKSTHEGSFFSKNAVDEIFKIVRELHNFCLSNSDMPQYPNEEVWFCLAVKIYKKNKTVKIGQTVTYMPWHKELVWSIDEIEALLTLPDILPKNKFAIKRIERNINDKCREYIGNYFNYRFKFKN
jgi:hypothetical protein